MSRKGYRFSLSSRARIFSPSCLLLLCSSLCTAGRLHVYEKAPAFVNVAHFEHLQRHISLAASKSSCESRKFFSLGMNDVESGDSNFKPKLFGSKRLAEAVNNLQEQSCSEGPRLLGSRRFAVAIKELQKEPSQTESDRLLWSRRLFRAFRGLTDTPPQAAKKNCNCSKAADCKLEQQRASLKHPEVDELISVERELREVSQKTVDILTPTSATTTTSQPKVERPELPDLTADDVSRLEKGERIQRQTRDGRVGTGMVVLDVEADIPLVFAVLTDVDRYPERISTVREAVTYQTGEKLRKTQFQLSKFRLKINTELRCKRDRNMLEFCMDPARPAPFLEDATGFWFLEDVSKRAGETRTRVWLVAGIACSALLPTPIVDYAASKALPRATAWVKPVMEQLWQELLPCERVWEEEEELAAQSVPRSEKVKR